MPVVAGTMRRVVGFGVLVLSAAFIAAATLTPSAGFSGSSDGLCLLACGSRGLADALANVLLFLPLGVGVALLSRSAWVTASAGLIASIAIELAQVWVVSGRDATPSDVISNTAGALLGAAIILSWTRWSSASPSAARRRLAVTGVCVVSLAVLTGVLLQPSLPRGPYVVRWTEGTERYAAYTGPVFGGFLGDRPIPAHGGVLGDDPGRDLARGRPLEVVLGPPTATIGLGHVLSFEQDEEDVLFLGVDGADVVLRTRLRSGGLRLDQPSLRLAEGMSSPASVGGVRLEVRTSSSGLCVGAGERLECPRHTIGSGWRLFYNVEPISEWVLARINSLWLFLVGLTLGVWVRGDRQSLLLLGGVVVGTAALPLTTGAAPLMAMEAGFGVLGIGAGWWLAAATRRRVERSSVEEAASAFPDRMECGASLQ